MDESKKDRPDRKITIVDIAKSLGISPATVSNALTGERYVKKETIEKVKKLVEELDYRPNMIARALRSKKRNIIGLLTSNINNPFYAQVISGVEDVVSKQGYILVINSTRFDRDLEIKAVKQLTNLLVDGLIFLGGSCDLSHINEIIPVRTPVVLINRMVEDSRYTTITTDYKRAVKKLAAFLAGNGHERIGYVGWDTDPAIIPGEKYRGYIEGLEELGIKPGQDLVFLKNSIPIREYREYRTFAHEIQHRVSGRKISALIAQSDPIALGLIKGFRESGLSIPEDLSITGIGNILQSQTSYPALTTIHVPKIRMGRFGAEKLLELISRGQNVKQTIYLKNTLINRGSVKDLRNSRDHGS
jgi:DNA-binding LacI/PurR family transcriptional regulator